MNTSQNTQKHTKNTTIRHCSAKHVLGHRIICRKLREKAHHLREHDIVVPRYVVLGHGAAVRRLALGGLDPLGKVVDREDRYGEGADPLLDEL